jgi:ADP-ribose pyrophosphatase YjhB (NUDIX family)
MENTQPYLQVGVKVLLKNSEGKFLLIRRNPNKYPEIGPKWDIVGGRIDIGTPLLENLKREVKEETGLEIISDPRLIAAQDILHVGRFPGRHIVRLTYTANAIGDPRIDEESLEFAWFTRSAIESLPPSEVVEHLTEILDKIF